MPNENTNLLNGMRGVKLRLRLLKGYAVNAQSWHMLIIKKTFVLHTDVSTTGVTC